MFLFCTSWASRREVSQKRHFTSRAPPMHWSTVTSPITCHHHGPKGGGTSEFNPPVNTDPPTSSGPGHGVGPGHDNAPKYLVAVLLFERRQLLLLDRHQLRQRVLDLFFWLNTCGRSVGLNDQKDMGVV